MYLIDTSVWLDYFRQRSNPVVAKFEAILEERLPYGITGVIYQEILQGADSQEDFSNLQTYLETQRFFHPLDPILTYRHAADLYFLCRRRGLTVRSTIDCLIAQIAIEHRLRLLHHDRDFTHIATVVKTLQLV